MFEPITLGLIAGITVYLGAVIGFVKSAKKTILGSLGAFSGGILAYLALETGTMAEEIVGEFARWETVNHFIIYSAATSISLLGTWLLLYGAERIVRKRFEHVPNITRAQAGPLLASIAISMALGLHNIGEGFAIASSLMQGQVKEALLFTSGFAMHNATEGFAIMIPATIASVNRRTMAKLFILLPALAGLPTMVGASVYYIGELGALWLAVLDTSASASLVYALIKVNLTSSSMLGGFNHKFWISLFAGVAITYALEGVLMLSMS